MKILGLTIGKSAPASGGIVSVQATAVPRKDAAEVDGDDRYGMLHDLSAGIARQMEKSMAYDQYAAYENSDSQGGYYGSEFDIRSTAGRIKGLYSREPWIYTTAFRIAIRLAAVPMRVYNKAGKLVEDHPLNKLLSGGSPRLSPLFLRMFQSLDMSLAGNYWIILEENMKGIAGIAPAELVSFKYSRDLTTVEGIEVYASGMVGTKKAFFPIEQVIHSMFPNPSDQFYGLSPFVAAARPVLLERYGKEFNMAFYLRGATQCGVIETTEDLSKSRFNRLMRTFENAFTGKANWWRTLFLPKGAKWVSSSLTMEQMQHLETMRDNKKDILAVMGVPGSLVGLVDDVNRATAEQQERLFYQNTIMPLALFDADCWNNSHLVKVVYKGQVEIRPDFTEIEAVSGSATTKGEQATAMMPYFTINEIRQKVWMAEPLPPIMGDTFARTAAPGIPGLTLAQPTMSSKAMVPQDYVVQTLIFGKERYADAPAVKAWCDAEGFACEICTEAQDNWLVRITNPDLMDNETLQTMVLKDTVEAVIGKLKAPEEKGGGILRLKLVATASQNRVEEKLTPGYNRVLQKAVDRMIEAAAEGMRNNGAWKTLLLTTLDERRSAYAMDALPVLEKAMDRGFSNANSQVKMARAFAGGAKRFTEVTEQDRQAIDVIRERTRDGERRFLRDRSIAAFSGFDKTQTEMIEAIIEQGLRDGSTFEQIASSLRSSFEESYRNQFRTVAKTEILTAVSQGLKWNNTALNSVFTEVKKAWLSQGDGGINPDAREEHAAFEELGEIGSNDTWTAPDGSELAYPRDPNGSARQIINCRCTMISVIPDSATSNADAILETEG